jgi:hypothetical protein
MDAKHFTTAFTIEDTAVVLIDHQVGTCSWVHSIDAALLEKNVNILATFASKMNMPLVLTSSMFVFLSFLLLLRFSLFHAFILHHHPAAFPNPSPLPLGPSRNSEGMQSDFRHPRLTFKWNTWSKASWTASRKPTRKPMPSVSSVQVSSTPGLTQLSRKPFVLLERST